MNHTDNKKDLAAQYHKRGYNCAQAVLCAFADELGAPHDLLFRISEGFGGGMGGMGDTCGAVTAVYMALGLQGSTGPEKISKAATYARVRRAADDFRRRNSSLICRELKGDNPTGAPLRSCPGCIEDAVELLEAALAPDGLQ